MEPVVKCKTPTCGNKLPISKLIMGYCPLWYRMMLDRQRQR